MAESAGLSEYYKMVFAALMKLREREEIVISQKVAPQNRENFVRAGKLFIDIDAAKEQGMYCEFSNDYSKIRKLKR